MPAGETSEVEVGGSEVVVDVASSLLRVANLILLIYPWGKECPTMWTFLLGVKFGSSICCNPNKIFEIVQLNFF